MIRRTGWPHAGSHNHTEPIAASPPRWLMPLTIAPQHIPRPALPLWPSLDEQVAIRAALIYNMVIDPDTEAPWADPWTGERQEVALLAPAAFASVVAMGQKEAVTLSTDEDREYLDLVKETDRDADAARAAIEDTDKIRDDLVEFPVGSQRTGREAITRHQADQRLAEDREQDGDSRHRQRMIDRLWIVLAAIFLAALDVLLLWRPLLNLGALDSAGVLYKWVLALAFAGAQAYFIDLAVHRYRERHREAFELRDAMKDHRRGVERGFVNRDRTALARPAPPVEDVHAADGELRGAFHWLVMTAVLVGAIGVVRVAFLSRGTGQSIAEATLFGAVVGIVLGGLVLLLGSVACRGNRLGDRLQAGAAVVAEIGSRILEGERRIADNRDAARIELTAAEDARARASDTRAWVIGEYRQAVLLATGWLGLDEPSVELVAPRKLEIADAAERQVQEVTAKLEVIDRWLAIGGFGEALHGKSSAPSTAPELPVGTSASAPDMRSYPTAPPAKRTVGVAPLSPQLPPPPAEPWWLLLAGAVAAVAIAIAAAVVAPTPEGDGLLAFTAAGGPAASAVIQLGHPVLHVVPGLI